MKQAIVLAIAGSDSGAGAGIQADIKICAALGVYCVTAITAITAQNTKGVQALESIAPALVKAQLDSLANDFNIQAIKLGMLGGLDVARTVYDFLSNTTHIPLIIDPVIKSSSGHMLVANDVNTQKTSSAATRQGEELEQFYLDYLFPLATLCTPNLHEAAKLLKAPSAEDEAQMKQQAHLLMATGCPNILIKGGHLDGPLLTDLLLTPDHTYLYRHPKIESANTHGTGCTLSSAIAAKLCQGLSLASATEEAIEHVQKAILASRDDDLGEGSGPLRPFL